MQTETEIHSQIVLFASGLVAVLVAMVMPWETVPFLPALCLVGSAAAFVPAAYFLWKVLGDGYPWQLWAPVAVFLFIPFWGVLSRTIELVEWTHRLPPAPFDPYDVPEMYWWGTDSFIRGPGFVAMTIVVGMIAYLAARLLNEYRHRNRFY